MVMNDGETPEFVAATFSQKFNLPFEVQSLLCDQI